MFKIDYSRALLLLAGLALAVVLAGPAAAEQMPAGLEKKEVVITAKSYRYGGPDAPTAPAINPEQEEVDTMVGLIYIKDSAQNRNDIKDQHVVYRFNGRTKVFGAGNQEVSMNDLLTPCKAKIYFYPNPRKAPVLYRIDMLARFNSSTKKWNTDHERE